MDANSFDSAEIADMVKNFRIEEAIQQKKFPKYSKNYLVPEPEPKKPPKPFGPLTEPIGVWRWHGKTEQGMGLRLMSNFIIAFVPFDKPFYPIFYRSIRPVLIIGNKVINIGPSPFYVPRLHR